MNSGKQFKWDEIVSTCAKEAKPFGVNSAVDEEDFIFQFCINHDCFADIDKAIRYYFAQGQESANKLASIVENYGDRNAESLTLLEFASGFGAVTRHLSKILPEVNITACDIHEKAVDFIKNTLNFNAEISNCLPDSLNLPQKYDVIFALSFFSHMPKVTWGKWLRALVKYLKKDGILIFTTHGAVSCKNFNSPVTDEDGFWFKPESEQHDLEANQYGMTVTLKKFVMMEIDQIKNVTLEFYREAFWWEHQDVYVLRKA